jgi:hypothetical protein
MSAYCYTNESLCNNVTPDDGQGERLKHVEFLEIKAKIQLLLVGYIHTYYTNSGNFNFNNASLGFITGYILQILRNIRIYSFWYEGTPVANIM